MYVVQCMSGKEADVQSEIGNQGYAARLPTVVRIERFGGRWLDRLRVMMPGYVFVDSPMNDELYYNVKAVAGVLRWLNPGRPMQLTEDETAFIRRLTPNNMPLLPLELETTPQLKIHNGPLAGLEHKIIDLNRRQRKIRICSTVLGEGCTISLSAHFRDTPEGHQIFSCKSAHLSGVE